jgi:TPR repeat protein
VLYQWGNGVDKDTAKAVHLYSSARDAGHVEATFNLGHCYYIGDGVVKDEAQARALWVEAAAAGSEPARRQLRDGYKIRPYTNGAFQEYKENGEL